MNLSLVNKVQALQTELNQIFAERAVHIEAILAALISRTHVLLLGPPGTGKSFLARALCNSIDGGSFFEWLLTKFSTPEEVFGPISMKGLKNDEYRRCTVGKLPECNIAFLDEIFKANSAILNSLLSAINERIFFNNGHPIQIPLLSCIGASNELPQGEELGALYDRFLTRFWVDYIQDDTLFCDLINPNGITGKKESTIKLTMAEVEELQELVEEVVVPDQFLGVIRNICSELRMKHGISASDRRWRSIASVIRAYALLRGRTTVNEDDLDVLANMLWDKPSDKKTIEQVIAPHTNPLNLIAMQYMDAAKEAYIAWKKGNKTTEDSLKANGILKDIIKKLEEQISSGKPEKTKHLVETRDQISTWRKEVVDSVKL